MIRFLHGADFHLDSAFGALPPGNWLSVWRTT